MCAHIEKFTSGYAQPRKIKSDHRTWNPPSITAPTSPALCVFVFIKIEKATKRAINTISLLLFCRVARRHTIRLFVRIRPEILRLRLPGEDYEVSSKTFAGYVARAPQSPPKRAVPDALTSNGTRV